MNKISFLLFILFFGNFLTAQTTGCADSNAENYFCNTAEGQTSCVFEGVDAVGDPIFSLPSNFIDDGSCLLPGCTNPLFLEFYTQGFTASSDDGSCLTEVVIGCTDLLACNFIPSANIASDNCSYAEQYYDCDGNCLVDSDGDGICDELDLNCDVTVTPVLTNLCEGDWLVYLDFVYTAEVSDLDNVNVIITSLSTGNVFTPEIASVSLNSSYDVAYIINTPGDYLISFSETGECSLGGFEIQISDPLDVSVSYEVLDPSCINDTGTLLGSLDGPSGIYQTYINGVYFSEFSIGLESVEFDVWDGNSGVDCLGNSLSGQAVGSQILNLDNFSGLEIGDEIGAFFIHPTCGLSSAGSVVFNGENTAITLWGDDSGTSEIEGFTEGQEIIWLVNSVSDGLIYNANIVWSDQLGLDSGSIFVPNGLGSAASFSLGDTYEDSFEINLPSGVYDFAVYDGDCLIVSDEIEIMTPPSSDDVGYSITDNSCSNLLEGAIVFEPTNDFFEYTVSLVSLTTGLPMSANPDFPFSFENLPGSDYFLLYNDITCGSSGNAVLSVSSGVSIDEVDLGEDVTTCEETICLEPDFEQNVGSENSLSFNGIDNYIDAGTIGNELQTSYFYDFISVGVWFKAQPFSLSDDQAPHSYIVGKIGGNPGFGLGITYSGELFFEIGTQNNAALQGFVYATNDNCNQSYADDKWHFAVGTYDGVTSKIFVDGELMGSYELNGGPIYDGEEWPFTIGYRNYFGQSQNYYNGLIRDVSLFDYPLSESEASDLYCSELTGDEDGLRAYWPMNEGSGSTLVDASPNAIDLFINSATWDTESNPDCSSLSYVWSTGETSLSIDVSTSSNYSVEMINELGCSESDAVNVIFNVQGCTDLLACNYDENAVCDDESCEYPDENALCDGVCEDGYINIDGDCVQEIFGCTDSTAFNYDLSANVDDGSCEAIVEGCTDFTAFNYDSSANVDDGSCCYIDGCTDSSSFNYNSSACFDDGSCCYIEGCTDSSSFNYNSSACFDDGSCCYIAGCTDSNSFNYNSSACFDDGSCIAVIEGCLDEMACNYNSFANVDDALCVYLDGVCETCEDGLIIDNDFDDDGVCNEDEVSGCTNSLACNYNPNATNSCFDIEGFTFLGLDNGSGYYISNIQATWEDANSLCNSLGGSLTSISSQQEQDFIFTNVNNVISNNYWIGLNDTSVEGDFVWTNGQDLIYTNWNTGEPNGFLSENYVEVFSQNAISPGFWNDAPANIIRYYVLEIEGLEDCCIYLEGECDTCENGVVLDNDQDGDGICDEDEILGCTDSNALNYNLDATDDDGSCIELVFGCIDEIALNYNENANTDDGSCEYEEIELDFEFSDNITFNSSFIIDGGLQVEAILDCGTTGSIEIIVTGGLPGTYVYTWFQDSDGDGVEDVILVDEIDSVLDDIVDGSYCVSVSDATGSSSETICFNIGENISFIDEYLIIQPACSDDLGSIQLILDPLYSSDDLTFEWFYDLDSDGVGDAFFSNEQNLINLPPLLTEEPGFQGGYYLTVSNGSCSQDTLITINQGEDMQLLLQQPSDFNGYEIACFGSANAEMLLFFTGGQPPYDLFISVDGVSGLVASDISSPYTYSEFDDLWDGPDGSLPIDSITGNYQFIIQAADGNCSVISDVFEYNQPDELEIEFNNTSDCYDLGNVPDGQINLTVSGGVPPYIIQYDSNGDGSPDGFGAGTASGQTISFNNLPAGIYDMSIEDANDCVVVSSQEVLSNGIIDLSYSGEPFNCFDDTTAYFNIIVDGGIAPYTYQWFDTNFNLIEGVSDDNIIEFTNLLTGSYFFSVTDSGGCTPSSLLGVPTGETLFTFTVNQVDPIEIDYEISEPLICYGDSAAYVNFSISQTGEFTSNSFSLYVDSLDVTIDSLIVTPGSIDLDFCYPALNNGMSQSIITNNMGMNFGGTVFPPFSTNLQEGDVFGFFNLVNPALNSSGYQCVGGIQGGTSADCGDAVFISPLEYGASAFVGDNLSFITWFEESTDPNLGVLSSSNPNFISNEVVAFVERDGVVYGATVDFVLANLPGQQFVDFYQSNTFMYIESIIVDDEPFIGGDGEIEVCVLNPMFEDEYSVTFIDQYGCSQSVEFTVPAPQEPIVSSFEIINELTCADASNGVVGISISGGYGDYDVFLYGDGATVIDSVITSPSCPTPFDECDQVLFGNLSQGDYYIVAVDSLGCEHTSASFEVSAPDPIIATYTISDYNGYGVSCNTLNTGDSSDGFISIEIGGGVGPYNILIEDLDGNSFVAEGVDTTLFTYIYEISGLDAGSYLITIQDSNGCDYEYQDSSGIIQDTYVIDLIAPEPLVVVADITDITCFEGEGDIVLFWEGGAPFSSGSQYQFVQPTGVDPDGVNTLITIQNSFNQTGYFAEEAIDANGCSVLFEVYMSEPNPVELVGDVNDYLSDYNGYSTSCSGASDGQIGIENPIEVTGGTGPFSYSWFLELPDGSMESINPILFGADEFSLDGVPAGDYILEITDLSGFIDLSEIEPCVFSFEFNLTQPDILGISPSESQSLMVVDYDFDGVVDDWFQDVELNIENNELLIYGEYGVSCAGSDNGFININIEGGTGEYSYSWSGDVGSDGVNDFVSNAEDLSGLSAGTYTVVVTDDNYSFSDGVSCYVTQTYILEEPDSEVDAVVSIYQYNSGDVLEIVEYEAGDVIDYGVSCYGAQDGAIFFDVTGGTNYYYYELLDDNNNIISSGNNFVTGSGSDSVQNLYAGDYILTIYDSNYEFFLNGLDDFSAPSNYDACFFQIPILLTEPNEIIVNESHSDYYSNGSFEGFGVSCYGASDGYISIEASGGEGEGFKFNYTYEWSAIDYNGISIDLNGQESVPSLNGVPAGFYTLIVSDPRGCTQDIEVELTSPNSIDFIVNQPTDEDDMCFDISCYGENDAWIEVSPVNPDAGLGFSYVWTLNDNILAASESYIDNLGPGYYQLYVQDNLTGCQNSFGPIFISEPQPLYSNIDNVFISDFDGVLGDNDYNGYSVSCSLSTDGIIGVEIAGGVGVYSVQFFDNDGVFVGEVNASLDPQPCEQDLLVDLDIDGDGILNQNDLDIDGDGVFDNNGNCISNCNGGATYDLDGNCISNCQNNDDLPYYFGVMSTLVELDGLGAGVYSVLISDGFCILDTITGIELIAPPDILDAQVLQIDSVSCFGLSDGAVLAEFFGGLPNNWNWGFYETDSLGMFSSFNSDADVLVEVGVNLFEPELISIDNLSAGFYRLDIYDVNGFFVSDISFANLGLSAPLEYLQFNQGCAVSLAIQIHEPPVIDTTNVNLVHPCFNDSSGVISFDLIGENPPFDVLLNNNSIGFYGNNVELGGLPSGEYIVSVFDVNNCSSTFEFALGSGYVDLDDISTEFFINHFDDDSDGIYDHIEMPDCEFSFDGSIYLPEIINDNDPNFSFTYFWEVDTDFDGNVDYVSYDESLEGVPIGVYTLNVVDDIYGCVVVFDYVLEEGVDCPEVPTGFSPNGDGVNDYWVVGGLGQYVDAEVSVYNRWGQLVFYSPNNQSYWDGRNQGKDMPTADYFYIINNSDGVNLSHGRVTLRR